MEKPKRKNSRVLWIILGLIAIFFLMLLALFALISVNRNIQSEKNFNSRPLVLIHAPLNHEIFETGEVVSVHATAREASVGLGSVELWVDDVRIAIRPAPEGETPDSLLLSESWIPTVPGRHVVIVRAAASNGVQGQATVLVEVVERAGTTTGLYPVEEGDTLVSIAEAVGSTPEELSGLNPDLGGSDPNPGDDLVIPGADGSGEVTDRDGTDGEEPEPGEGDDDVAPGGGEEDEDTSPDPEDDPPGDEDPFAEMREVFPDMGGDEAVFHGEPVALRVEILDLSTAATDMEGLYCYLDLGLQPTLRAPDVDGDPTTDESFAPLGSGAWDVATYLAGGNAPIVYWTDGEALPFGIACVGIAAGGTDAVPLNSLEGDFPPGMWDGTVFHDVLENYEYSYRITRVNDMRAAPLYLDPDMTPPTNIRLDEESSSLLWDFSPRADEDAITGFRIYLNGSLQWVETAGQRASRLPPEWFNPPCGTTYTFAVTAYRFDLPDGLESPPGEASLTAPSEGEGCQQQIAITFLTLETFDLGGDVSHERRDGDVGPPYGEFFANQWQASFDARDDLFIPMGLRHNTVYNLAEVATYPDWGFNMQPNTVVTIPEGDSLELGFTINDHDAGRCSYDGDPDCDDVVCQGSLTVTDSLDLHQEGIIYSTNRRCQVAYNFSPAPGSPLGSGAAGSELPLPWLDILDVNVNDESGEVSFILHNTGSAAWSGRPLEVAMRTRTGEELGVITYDSFELAAGQRMGMGSLGMGVEPPYDVCVMVDPNNMVQEYYEAYDGRSHNWYCPQLPDLMITDVQYDASGRGRMLVTVRNTGRGGLEHRNVNLHWDLADGSSVGLLRVFEDISLRPFESTVFEVAGIDAGTRASLEGGYSVYVDHIWNIAESNEDNNIYTVSPVRLKVWSCNSCIPEHYSGGVWQWDSMDIFVNKVRGSISEEIYYVRREEYSAWDGTPHIWHLGCESGLTCDTGSRVFNILEDEKLQVRVLVEQNYIVYTIDLGDITRTFTVDDEWGGFPAADENDWNHRPYCQFITHTPEGEDENWWTTLCILQLPE